MSSPAEYIKAAALAALNGTGTFLHERPEQATVSANDAPVPLIVLGGETTNQATGDSRVIASSFTLYFGDTRPGYSDDADGQNAAVARMRALAARFFAALNHSPVTRMDSLRETPFYNAYEATLDGVGIQLTLTVPAGRVCPPVLPLPPEPAGGFPYVFGAAVLV